MKTPDSRQASSGVSGEQLPLFDSPSFSPMCPNPTSLCMQALTLLLKGRSLTHPEFERITSSWRLAACIAELRSLGWPIMTHDICSPFENQRNRTVAMYSMPQWVSNSVNADGSQKI
jgi:hypothetical protein